MTKHYLSSIRLAIIYLPFIIVLIGLSFICFRWALANVYATQVEFILDNEDDTISEANLLAWRRAKIQMHEALFLRPNSTVYLELADNFYQKLSDLEVYAPELMQRLTWTDNQNIALKYVRQALMLKPSWPYLWESLAVSKIALNEFDDELLGAINRAMTLGPWQQIISIDLSQFGLDIWNRLTEKDKIVVLQAMERALKIAQIRHDSQINDAFLMHENFSIVCVQLNLAHSVNLAGLEHSCKSKNWEF